MKMIIQYSFIKSSQVNLLRFFPKSFAEVSALLIAGNSVVRDCSRRFSL